MASKTILIFILPILFSIAFASAVMIDIVQKPDRALNLWPMSEKESQHSYVTIIGMSKQYYSVSESIDVQVMIHNPNFSCVDLDVRVFLNGNDGSVTQKTFSDQCFGENNLIPVDDVISLSLVSSGSYTLMVQVSNDELGFISANSKTFTIR